MYIINATLAFLLEIAMLCFYGYGGYRLFENVGLLRYVAMIALPAVVIVIWSMWIAPKADDRLDMPWILIAKIILFSGAALLVLFASRVNLAVGLTVLVAAHLLLATCLKEV